MVWKQVTKENNCSEARNKLIKGSSDTGTKHGGIQILVFNLGMVYGIKLTHKMKVYEPKHIYSIYLCINEM